jgi:uncharacterized membrane protein YeaQ/YmgE (transglycosylase-associated protein family)
LSIIAWIVLGLLAGMIAKALMPVAPLRRLKGATRSAGVIVTTLLGIAGALVGGFLATALGLGEPIDEFFDLGTWVAAVVGALVILFIWNAVGSKRLALEPRA